MPPEREVSSSLMERHDPPDELLSEWRNAEVAAFEGRWPIECPSGDDEQLRYLFVRHSEPPDLRGGFWIWCPRCHSYEHASAAVPDWWEEVPAADGPLTHDPGWLDEHWKDEWLRDQPRPA